MKDLIEALSDRLNELVNAQSELQECVKNINVPDRGYWCSPFYDSLKEAQENFGVALLAVIDAKVEEKLNGK